MRVLGIDYGRARVGLALGDTETKLATPWQVLRPKTKQELLDQLDAIAKQEGVERLVVGVPHPLSDQSRDTEQSREIRRFIRELAKLGLPIDEENETLTSALAARQVTERGERGKRDDLAAAAILQSYLDRSSF